MLRASSLPSFCEWQTVAAGDYPLFRLQEGGLYHGQIALSLKNCGKEMLGIEKNDIKTQQTDCPCLLFASGEWKTVAAGNCSLWGLRKEGQCHQQIAIELINLGLRILGINEKSSKKIQANSLLLLSLCKWQVANSGGGQCPFCGLWERGHDMSQGCSQHP